jgi:hypothetical protein
MNLHTVSARSAAALVAVIAGAASWEHIASVAYGAGERAWVAYSLPAAIDGLIVVGVAALLEDRARGLRSRWRARTAVVAGVLATLAANIASAEPTATARLVAVAAPVSFLLAIEVLSRPGRKVEETEVVPLPRSLDGADASPTRPSRRAGGRRSAAVKVAAARVRLGPDATQGQVAKAAKVSIRSAARYWAGTAPEPVAEPSPNSREHSGTPVTVDA